MSGIFFNVNGKDIYEQNVDPEVTLAYYLRNKLGLRGTKIGCEEGVCGSCTVVLGSWKDDKAVYRAVNGCLVPLFHCHRTFIITVEGVGSTDKIHPIQDRLARGHALQCGFCSPGFVMSAYALLRNNPKPSMKEIDGAVRGNLCRCTGYRPILEALYSFSEKGGCCGGKKNGGGCCKDKVSDDEGIEEDKLLTFDDFPKYDPTQEIIFPPSLRTHVDSEETVILQGKRIIVFLPKTLEQFVECRKYAKVISSGLITGLSTVRNPKQIHDKWVSTKYVREFHTVEVGDDVVTIGGTTTIQTFSDVCKRYLTENIGNSITDFLNLFSSQQVANFATWSGGITMGAKSKNVSDILLLFIVIDAKLTLLDRSGEQRIVTVEDYAKLKLYETTTILNAIFDRKETRKLFLYKLGETGEEDSTVFNFGALIGNCSKTTRVFAGLGGIPKRLSKVESLITSDKEKTVDALIEATNMPDVNQFTPTYDRLLKFLSSTKPKCDEEPITYLQYFQPTENESVGRPIANFYNERAITGEAIYVNDIQSYGALHLGFVLSTVPHAEVLDINYTEALKLDGVVDYVDVKDVPNNNKPGLSGITSPPDDTTLFADGEVKSVGQIIAAIAATDVMTARRAAKLVVIKYKILPSLIDLNDSIKENVVLGQPQQFGKKEEEVNKELEKSYKILEGELTIGGQEHYYMETQNSLVVPGENHEMVVHCATQGISFTQLAVAETLGVPANKIIVKTKRLGGGFGGKVSNASWIAAICAITARKLNRPVYGCLSRQDDFIITGKRHPALAKYRVGIDKEGKVMGIHYKAWLNGGWSIDHSETVTMVMGLKIDDVYDMKCVRFDGYPMMTNTCSNTALRGYGNPQGKLVNESVMRRIAHEVGKSVEEVKKLNFLLENGTNFLGGRLFSDALLECWEHCQKMSDFENRSKMIDEFNKTSKTVKRGIAMSSVRFGLPHPGPTAHGIASLLINLDGSIQLSIGGTEMGQGLYQKMLQVCSEALKRPIETITIIDSSTDKVTNAPETGGSQNADTNGLAVLACCQRILSRLQPILDKNDGDWNKAVMEAFESYVPLQCTEYGLVDRKKNSQDVSDMESPYNTTGACAVEVEIDVLTGFNKVLRVDMVMDVGESLNPALDIGQIEGAFMQGYGLVTCEKITFNKETGQLDQNTAWKYKLPKASMTPKNFRVKLLDANKVKGAQVYSSKGIGEPPLMMSCAAVHSALMKSIESWRTENGIKEFVESVSPLSSDKIIELCSLKK